MGSSPELDEDCGTRGNRTVLAIRVVGPDSETTSSADEIADTLFGSNGKSFTMKSQFAACSYDQFTPIDYKGETTTGFNVANGVAEVTITNNVLGTYLSVIEDEVLREAETKLGDLESQFNFVFLFIPPGTILAGTSEWKAYAFLNHWLSVYNDAWTKTPSIHIHEIGHNIGLGHSHTDNLSYGDNSCYMGVSASQVDGPVMCFNAPKSWALGWYMDSVKVIDVEAPFDGYYNVKLIGISDYGVYQNVSSESFWGTYHPYTIVKLTNTVDSFDYYINFNVKSGITSGSGEAANAVLVSRQSKLSNYADSYLVATIKNIYDEEGQYFAKDLRKDGAKVRVYAFDFYEDESPPNVLVNIFASSSSVCFKVEDCINIDSCSAVECVNNECIYSEQDCATCGSNFTMEITTNKYPSNMSWAIENIDRKRIVMSNNNLAANSYYAESKCLEFANYRFFVSYEGNDTLADNVTYRLQSGNHIVFEESENLYFEVEDFFTVCGANEDCRDFNGCTTDHCNLSNKLCENT